MGKKTSLKTNFFYNAGYRVLSLITPLLTAPYVARVLGVEIIGQYSYTQSIVVYFGLIAALGSGTHGQRGIAGYRDDKSKMSKFFYEIVILRFVTTVLSLILYGLYMWQFGKEYTTIFALQATTVVACAFDITWLYQGLENFKKTVTRQVFIKIVGVVAVLVFVKSPSDFYLYILCYSVPTLLGNILLWPGVSKIITSVDYKELYPLKHLRAEIELFIPYIATLSFTYIGKTMIGSLSDVSENGYYEQALKFITIAAGVVSAFSTVIVPRMAYYFKQKDTSKIQHYIKEGVTVIMILSTLLVAGMFSIGGNVIPWFYGAGYERSITILEVLCFVTLFKGINTFMGSSILIASFRQGMYSISIWVSTIINVLLNFVLIPQSGAVGASVTAVISEIVLFFMLLYFVRDSLTFKQFFKYSYKPLIAGLIATTVVYRFAGTIRSSIINSALLGSAVVAIYAIVLLGLREEYLMGILEKLVGKLVYKGEE